MTTYEKVAHGVFLFLLISYSDSSKMLNYNSRTNITKSGFVCYYIVKLVLNIHKGDGK